MVASRRNHRARARLAPRLAAAEVAARARGACWRRRRRRRLRCSGVGTARARRLEASDPLADMTATSQKKVAPLVFSSAILCIRYSVVSKWAEQRGIAFTTYTDLSARADVYDLLRAWLGDLPRLGVQQAAGKTMMLSRLDRLPSGSSEQRQRCSGHRRTSSSWPAHAASCSSPSTSSTIIFSFSLTYFSSNLYLRKFL